MPIEVMNEQCPPITAGDLAQLERTLGVELPDDYKQFLLRWNGGAPQPTSFGLSRLGFFYSITPERRFDIATRHNSQKEWIPRDTLLVGVDAGGNQIVLGVGKQNFGKVYFVDHEMVEGETAEERTKELAPSWSAFIDSLH